MGVLLGVPQSFVFPDYSRAGAKIREDWRAGAKIREDWRAGAKIREDWS